jgi:hypothetical protein
MQSILAISLTLFLRLDFTAVFHDPFHSLEGNRCGSITLGLDLGYSASAAAIRAKFIVNP